VTTPTCAEPRFVWLPERQRWSPCQTCRRLAWHHEQADPAADLANIKIIWAQQLPPENYPPVMRNPT
jgi:hypothetical protein